MCLEKATLHDKASLPLVQVGNARRPAHQIKRVELNLGCASAYGERIDSAMEETDVIHGSRGKVVTGKTAKRGCLLFGIGISIPWMTLSAYRENCPRRASRHSDKNSSCRSHTIMMCRGEVGTIFVHCAAASTSGRAVPVG